jgi:hypothetical protein
LQRGFVINIARSGVNAGLDRLRRDPAIAVDLNILNDLPGLRRGEDLWNQSKKQQANDQP